MSKRKGKTVITHFQNADGSHDVFKNDMFYMTMKSDKFERFIELCEKSTNYQIVKQQNIKTP